MIVTALSTMLALQMATPQQLVNGKLITPIGEHTSVGSYPVNMVLSPDGKALTVTDSGYRQHLTTVDAATGKVLSDLDFGKKNSTPKEALYYGLAYHPTAAKLFVSRGNQDMVSVHGVGSSGLLSEAGDTIKVDAKAYPAGLAFNSTGSKLLVVNNQTNTANSYKGSLSIVNTQSGDTEGKVEVGGFPLAVANLTSGPQKDKIAYVTNERDDEVSVIDLDRKTVIRTIHTGANPNGLVLSKDQSKLYVSNYGSDTISVINTRTDSVVDTIVLRPNEMRGLPGAGPNSVSISPDGNTLYATLMDMNAVAVVDTKTNSLKGLVPTGWLPTKAVATDKDLFVTCAKGVKAMNPNHKPVGTWGQYGQDIIDGSLTRIPLVMLKDMKKLSAQVAKNNFLRSDLTTANHPTFRNPGIKHVIYVVKENRTYDNVLADLPQGNGDKSVCLFPREITPNQHALAERFVLMDNFYVCAECSQDGWSWSTTGMVNAYASRNTPTNYSGRGRSYDTEGSNNGVPIDLLGMNDVTRPPSGYIWEHCAKHGVSYRNYGMFMQFADAEDKRFNPLPTTVDSRPTKKLLEGNSDIDFLRYDLTYADSEIYDEYGWSSPRRRKTYGSKGSTSRIGEFKKEFAEFVAKGEMPNFLMVRLGNDHTSGTSNGQPTPQSMVADNDYAVGQLVELISHSPFWKVTAICILEDDSQAGYDHVDSHRSTAYVISPYIKKGTVDSNFYNTDSMLRTMELLLGMPPMSQFDAVAPPFKFFGPTAANMEPYTAIKPSREIVCKANGRTAYRSNDSNRIPLDAEESEIDEHLNDILWGAVRGANTKRPKGGRSGLFPELLSERD